MRLNDRFTRVMLVVLAGLLAANLAVSFSGTVARAAEASSAQKAGGSHDFFGGVGGTGVSVTTSADGKIVYAADGEDVYRSLDFGKPGSWEHVLE